MPNIDGQQARNWQKKDTPNINKIANTVGNGIQQSQAIVLNKISEVLKEYVNVLYGAPNQDKYVKIVDLISKEIKNIISDNINIFIDEDLEQFRTDLETTIKTILNSKNQNFNKTDITMLSDNIVIELTNLIEEKTLSLKQDLVNIFINNINSLKNENTEQTNNKQNIERSISVQNNLQQNNTKNKTDKNTIKTKNSSQQLKIIKIIDTLFDNISKQCDAILATFNELNKIVTKNLKQSIDITEKLSVKTIKNIQKKIYEKTQSTIVENELKLKKISEKISVNLTPDKKTKKILKQIENIKEQLIEKINKINKKIIKLITDIRTKLITTVNKTLNIINKGIKKISTFLTTTIIMALGKILALIAIVGIILRLLEPIIVPYLQKFEKFCVEYIDSAAQFLQKIISSVIEKTINFVLNIIGPPLKFILNAIAKVICFIIPLIAKSIAFVMNIILFVVDNLIKVQTMFLDLLMPYAEKLGQFFVVFAMTVFDILETILTNIKPYAGLLGQFLVVLAINIIDILTKIANALNGKAEMLGKLISGIILVTMIVINKLVVILKPVAFILGAALGGLIFILGPIINIIYNIIKILYPIFDKLGLVVKIIFTPLKLVAFLAGVAFSFFVLVTAKFISAMIKFLSTDKTAVRNAAIITVMFICYRLKEFLNDIKKASEYNEETQKEVANVDYLNKSALDKILDSNSETNLILTNFQNFLNTFQDSWDKIWNSDILGPYFFLKGQLKSLSFITKKPDNINKEITDINNKLQSAVNIYNNFYKRNVISFYKKLISIILNLRNQKYDKNDKNILPKIYITNKENDQLLDFFKNKYKYNNERKARRNEEFKTKNHFRDLLDFLKNITENEGKHSVIQNNSVHITSLKESEDLLAESVAHNLSHVNSIIEDIKQNNVPIIINSKKPNSSVNIAMMEVQNG